MFMNAKHAIKYSPEACALRIFTFFATTAAVTSGNRESMHNRSIAEAFLSFLQISAEFISPPPSPLPHHIHLSVEHTKNAAKFRASAALRCWMHHMCGLNVTELLDKHGAEESIQYSRNIIVHLLTVVVATKGRC